jgi:hypothetical protein
MVGILAELNETRQLSVHYLSEETKGLAMKGVVSSKPGAVSFNWVEYGDPNFSIDDVRRYKIRDEDVAVGNFINHIPHRPIITSSADVWNVVNETIKSSLHSLEILLNVSVALASRSHPVMVPGSAAKGRWGVETGTGGALPGGTKAAMVLLNVIVSQLRKNE